MPVLLVSQSPLGDEGLNYLFTQTTEPELPLAAQDTDLATARRPASQKEPEDRHGNRSKTRVSERARGQTWGHSALNSVTPTPSLATSLLTQFIQLPTVNIIP